MEQKDSSQRSEALSKRNWIVGLVMAAVGVYVIVESFRYGLGSVSRLGPGALPFGLGFLIIGFGGLIAFVNDDGDEDAPPIVLRPFITIVGAILAFAVLIEPVGLAGAAAALVFISGAADPEHNWRSLIAIYLFLVVTVYVVFVQLLGIPFKLLAGVI